MECVLTEDTVPVLGRFGYAEPIAAGLGMVLLCLFVNGVVIFDKFDLT